MKKLSNDFLMHKLRNALQELEKLSYDFAVSIPKAGPVFIQEVDNSEFFWQVEMSFLQEWSEEDEQYLMFAVDVRDGYVRLSSVIIYSRHGKPEVKIDNTVHVIYPRRP